MIRVMVVDDHDFVRSMMCELIDGTDDMQVVGEAEDGAQAVAVARETAPDVVLMDLSMPVMNGIDATREVDGLGSRGARDRADDLDQGPGRARRRRGRRGRVPVQGRRPGRRARRDPRCR